MIPKKQLKTQLAIMIKSSIYNDLSEMADQMKITKTMIVEYALTELFERQAHEAIHGKTETSEAAKPTEATEKNRKVKTTIRRVRPSD